MGLTGGAAILAYAQPATAHGKLFDLQCLFDADLNYHISIRVTTRDTAPLSGIFNKKPSVDGSNQRDKLGDSFISGFLEGGQLDVLISIRLHDKRKQTEVIAAVGSIFESYPEALPAQKDLNDALEMIAEACETTIQTRQVGGTPPPMGGEKLSLGSLCDVLLTFPGNAAKHPKPIFAVLSPFDAMKSPDGLTPQFTSLAQRRQTALRANTLFDAYMEFRDMYRVLSTQISGIRAGTMEFDSAVGEASPSELRTVEPTLSGLAKTKRCLLTKMMEIISEAERMTALSAEAVICDFRGRFIEEAMVYRERLPSVRTLESSTQVGHNASKAQLLVGNEDELFPLERKKIRSLVAEHPDIADHARLAQPYGSKDFGPIFCSLDFFKDDWTVAAVGVQVAGGCVSAVTVEYTNGLHTEFGPRRKGGKLIALELDLSKQEKIVACSIETGRRANDKTPSVRVTAVRLSTNRGSVLTGQADDWKEPVGGESSRGATRFESLATRHYDPPLSNAHVVGFWGRASPTPYSDVGVCRLAPVWSDNYVAQTDLVAPGHIAEDRPECVNFPSGVWDTRNIHDWRNPLPRTQGVVKYTHAFPEDPLPNILLGARMIDTFGGASVRFDAVTESVTASSFAIGVEQWSDSLIYGAEFSWVGIPPNLRGVQAGNFVCHGPSTQRKISFPRPFKSPPQMLVWLSGLDLRIGCAKKVFAVPSAVSAHDFLLSVSGIGAKSLAYATVSWIAVDDDSPCLAGSFSVEVEEKGEAQGYCGFPAGKFAAPPTVLTAFSGFAIGGAPGDGINPRFGTCTWDETEGGFVWKIYKWSDSSIGSATIHWIAIPAQ